MFTYGVVQVLKNKKKYNKSQKFIASYSRGFGSNAFSPSPFETNIIQYLIIHSFHSNVLFLTL